MNNKFFRAFVCGRTITRVDEDPYISTSPVIPSDMQVIYADADQRLRDYITTNNIQTILNGNIDYIINQKHKYVYVTNPDKELVIGVKIIEECPKSGGAVRKSKYDKFTVKQLKELIKSKGHKSYSRMNRSELIMFAKRKRL